MSAAIPTSAPLESCSVTDSSSLPLYSRLRPTTAARYTAGKAAKIPPSLPPKVLAIRVEAKTALPPNRKRRNKEKGSMSNMMFLPRRTERPLWTLLGYPRILGDPCNELYSFLPYFSLTSDSFKTFNPSFSRISEIRFLSSLFMDFRSK